MDFQTSRNFKNRPLGVFDSGIGGLTVLKELKKILPGEDIVYFGDTARVPYGTKSKETVTRFSIQNADFLIKLGVKMIVVACNTSSSYSLEVLKRRFSIPVIGVIEPGAIEAVNSTKNMRIGVIGTRATVSSGAYKDAIKRIEKGISVKSMSCPLFVPLAEEGWFNNDITAMVASYYLKGLKREKIDTIILGCTHYPLLKRVVSNFFGPRVFIVDSAVQTSRMVKETLLNNDIASKKKSGGVYRFYVSDEPGLFKKVGSKFLGSKITFVKKVNIG